MASSSSVKASLCVKCEKGGGIAICSGCQQQFCVKHFLEHRQELSARMDEIGQQHDLLRQDLLKETSEHPFLARIQTWEQESIVKIQVAAEIARADLQQILDRRKTNAKSFVEMMTSEFQASQELENYTEIELDRWKKKLGDLVQLLASSAELDMFFDHSSLSSIPLIKITDYLPRRVLPSLDRRSHDTLERFDKCEGAVMLSHDALFAENIGDDYSRICGLQQYSSGMYRIRFRIDQRAHSCPFLGIISSSDALNLRKINLPSANGWSDFNYSIVNGKQHGKPISTQIIQTGDQVTLVLDCDNQQILLEHDRTNQAVRQAIDMQLCPFPWKLFIALLSPKESIRILI